METSASADRPRPARPLFFCCCCVRSCRLFIDFLCSYSFFFRPQWRKSTTTTKKFRWGSSFLFLFFPPRRFCASIFKVFGAFFNFDPYISIDLYWSLHRCTHLYRYISFSLLFRCASWRWSFLSFPQPGSHWLIVSKNQKMALFFLLLNLSSRLF